MTDPESPETTAGGVLGHVVRRAEALRDGRACPSGRSGERSVASELHRNRVDLPHAAHDGGLPVDA